MSGLADSIAPAVIPILPAVHSVLVVLLLCASGLIAGVWALRRPRAWRVLQQLLWSQKWSLLMIAALLGIGVLLAQEVSRRTRIADIPAATLDGQWSARGGHPRHGSIPGATAPTAGVVRWTGGIGQTFYASPAVVGDRVYNVGFSGDRGRIFCWDAHNGRQLWTRAVPGMRATFSSPVVHEHLLLVGEGLHHTRDASLFAIDLRPGREGEILWQFRTGSHIECTPVVADGHVFINAGDDGVYALDLNGKARPDRVSWHVPGTALPDAETSLADHAGTLFVGSGKSGEMLVALDASTGTQQARLDMGYPVHGLPSIMDHRLYVGMGTADYLNYQTSQGQVVCASLPSLGVQWTFPIDGSVLGAVVCDTHGVVFGATDGHVYALDHDGQLQAVWNSHAAILASVAVADGQVLVVNQSGVLYALDRRSLDRLWEVRLGHPGTYVSSPVVAHSRVYVGTPDDGFLCVGDPADQSVPNTDRHQAMPPTGQILWQRAVEGRITARPGVTRSTIVVPSITDRGTQLSGHSIGRTGLLFWVRPIDAPIRLPIATSGEIAVVATADELLAIDAPTGEVLWKVSTSMHVEPLIEDDRIWIDTGRGGAPRWKSLSLVDGCPAPPQTPRNAPRTSTTTSPDWKLTVAGELFIKLEDGRVVVLRQAVDR